jgi:hypothetical protein
VDRTATNSGIETNGQHLPFLKDIEQNFPLHDLRFCSRSSLAVNTTFLSFEFRSFALFSEHGTREDAPTPTGSGVAQPDSPPHTAAFLHHKMNLVILLCFPISSQKEMMFG